MGLFNDFFKSRANGSKKRGLAEVEADLARLQAAKAEKGAALAAANAKRAGAIDDDMSFDDIGGIDKQIAALKYELNDVLPRIDTKLRGEMRPLQIQSRQSEWNDHQAAILSNGRAFIVAARAASAAIKELTASMDAAGAAGFLREIRHIPVAPALFNLQEHRLTTIEAFALSIESYEDHRAKLPLAPVVSPERSTTPFSFDTESSLRIHSPVTVAAQTHGIPPRRIALFEAQAPSAPIPPAVKSVALAIAPAQSVRPAKPKVAPVQTPTPAVLPTPDADGKVGIVIMRRGYSTPDGVARSPSEKVRLLLVDAEAAVRTGCADFEQEGRL